MLIGFVPTQGCHTLTGLDDAVYSSQPQVFIGGPFFVLLVKILCQFGVNDRAVENPRAALCIHRRGTKATADRYDRYDVNATMPFARDFC